MMRGCLVWKWLTVRWLATSCILVLLAGSGFILAEGDSQYTLSNRWESAQSRLELLEKWSNPYTFAQLEKADVQKGWYCLDVGAGLGGSTRWLADKVGADGHVDALDMEPVFLEKIAKTHDNVQVLERNLVVDALPEQEYDFIFARYVLMHIPERKLVIDKLVRALKPGGLLMTEDLGILSKGINYQRLSNDPAVNEMAARMLEDLQSGHHMSFRSAYDAPFLFQEAGLRDVDSSAVIPLIRGGSLEGETLSLSLTQLKPLFMEKNYHEQTYDRLIRSYLEESALWWGSTRVTTTGRKPLTLPRPG